MARLKSDDRRNAILEAATRIIAAQGLSAATAQIAKEAGISTGSLFTYFDTKSVLLNDLFLDLKAEMAAAALNELPEEEDIRTQMEHMWSGWIAWATSYPQKRRALAQLAVSDAITPRSREAGHHYMAGVAGLLERSRAQGSMRSAPIGLVAGLLNAMAEATVDFIISDPDRSADHRAAGFAAAWRMLT